MKRLLLQLRRRHPVRFLLLFLALLTAFYSFLFWLLMLTLEDKRIGLISAFFWTISRLTTTGETVRSLEFSSLALQVLSVVVQISGLTFLFAAFPLVIIPRLEQRLRVLPTKVSSEMSEHVVICGYNPLVESLIDELASGKIPFVIVDDDPETIRQLVEQGVACVFGDPAEEEVLRRARVDQATTVISNKEDEANARVVLTAAALSSAQIIALIDDLAQAKYFYYAGAGMVLSPKELLGSYLARKAVTSLKDELFGENEVAAGLDVVELPIYPGSPVEGKSLGEAKITERTGASVVGIWHRGALELEPHGTSKLSAENVVVAVGSRDQLIELQKLTRIAPAKTEATKHFVIVGYGDVGRVVSQELKQRGVPYVIIDPQDRPGEYIKGDATEESTLAKASIETASTLIVASHIDGDNIFVTLLARKLNPELHILARANHRQSTDKLYRAGADFVFSLSVVAAQMLAGMIQGDRLITLAEGLKVSTVTVNGYLGSRTVGQLRIRSRTGCTIIALQEDQRLVANPGPETVLPKGARLVLLGTRHQIDELRRTYKV